MDRRLEDVIDQIIKIVPSDESTLLHQLKDNKSSVIMAPPELMQMWWGEVQGTLVDHIPDILTEDWQFEAWSIFSTKSIPEIKELLANR